MENDDVFNPSFLISCPTCKTEWEYEPPYIPDREAKTQANLRSDFPCPTCAARRGVAENDRMAEAGVPRLQGSDRQIDWAIQIRSRAVEGAKKLAMVFIQTGHSATQNEITNALLHGIIRIENAVWWIENRTVLESMHQPQHRQAVLELVSKANKRLVHGTRQYQQVKCTVIRPVKGRIQVKMPYGDGTNRSWLKEELGARIRPTWEKDSKHWTVARKHLYPVLAALLQKFGPVDVHMYYNRTERCDTRCQEAFGEECVCACEGKNHGGTWFQQTWVSVGKTTLINSETKSVKRRITQLSQIPSLLRRDPDEEKESELEE